MDSSEIDGGIGERGGQVAAVRPLPLRFDGQVLHAKLDSGSVRWS